MFAGLDIPDADLPSSCSTNGRTAIVKKRGLQLQLAARLLVQLIKLADFARTLGASDRVPSHAGSHIVYNQAPVIRTESRAAAKMQG